MSRSVLDLTGNAPDRRWTAAAAYVESKRPISRSEADPHIRAAYWFLRRWNNAKKDYEQMAIAADYPDLCRAFALYSDVGTERWMIEAGALADIPYSELGDYVNQPAKVVELYEALFYDVRPKLKARGYILNRVLMPAAARGMHGHDYDLLFKTVAYCGGWKAFQEFIDSSPMSPEVRKWVRDSSEDKLLKQGWIAAHRLDVNNFNAPLILELTVKLKTIEQEAGKQGLQDESLQILRNLLDQFATTIVPPQAQFALDEPRAATLDLAPVPEQYVMPQPAGK